MKNTIKMDLCRPCAEALKSTGRELTQTIRGVNQKVNCAMCRKRRYGAAYDVAREVQK